MQVLDFALSELYIAIEDWISQLTLQEIEPDPIYRYLQGQIRGIKVNMRSRAFVGSALQRVTLVEMQTETGKRLSVTLTAMPHSASPLPILGLDYVGFQETLSLAALDWFPTDLFFWKTHCKTPLQALKRQAQAQLTQRKTPEFAQSAFSPQAIFAAAKPPQLAAAVQIAQQMLQGFTQISHIQPLPLQAQQLEALQTRRQEWVQVMRNNKKEHSALAQIFGADLTKTYLEGFLFSSEQAAMLTL